MKKINLVVVDSSEKVRNDLYNHFHNSSKVDVLDVFKDGEEFLSYMLTNSSDVDAIVMDLLLPNMDGISLLHNLKKRGIEKKIIVLSSYNNDNITKEASNLGVDYYMVKPFNIDSFDDRLVSLFKNNVYESNKSANLEIEISELLHNLGVPSNILGYKYAREAVKFVCSNDSGISFITKEIYPCIASKFNSNSSRVERAIRHAIEVSWERGDLDLIEALFGHSIDYDRSKPTNSEFINTLADHIRLKQKVSI